MVTLIEIQSKYWFIVKKYHNIAEDILYRQAPCDVSNVMDLSCWMWWVYRSRCHSLCSGFFSHAAYTYPRPSGETVLYFTFHLFSTSRSFSLLQILPLPFSSRQLNPAEFSWQRTRSSVPKPYDKKHELKQTGDGQSELGGERCVERRT